MNNVTEMCLYAGVFGSTSIILDAGGAEALSGLFLSEKTGCPLVSVENNRGRDT